MGSVTVKTVCYIEIHGTNGFNLHSGKSIGSLDNRQRGSLSWQKVKQFWEAKTKGEPRNYLTPK